MASASADVDEIRLSGLAGAAAAFLFIFFVYVAGSTLLIPEFGLILPRVPVERAELGPTEVRDLTAWWIFAFLGLVLAAGTTVWCGSLLARYAPRRVFLWAISLFALLSLIAAGLAFATGNQMVDLAQQHVCADPAAVGGSGLPSPAKEPLFCRVPGKAALAHYSFTADESTNADLRIAQFAGHVAALKTLLNIVLQTAGIFVVGTMLTLTGLSWRRSEHSRRHFRRLQRGQVMPHLFLAAGAILSVTILTDILFSHWPINALARPGSPVAASLTELLTALTLYFALLSSLVLALTLIAARVLASTPLPLFPGTGMVGSDTILGRIGGFLFRRSTANALITLSPVLTLLVGNPVVRTLIEAMPSG